MTVGEFIDRFQAIPKETEIVFLGSGMRHLELDDVNHVPPVPAATEYDDRRPVVEVYLFEK